MQPIEPEEIGLRPGAGAHRRGDPAAEEQLAEPVLGAHLILLGVAAGPDQVAQGLVLFVGDPHRGEVTAAQQPAELEGIAAVGLDPVARTAGDQRGRDDHALDAQRGQLPVQRKPGRSRLVGDHQANSAAPEAAHQLAHGRGFVGDLAVRLRLADLLGDGNGEGLGMHIHADEPSTLTHGTGLHPCGSVRG